MIIGSRDSDRASAVVGQLLADHRDLELSGATNERAAEAKTVFVATPWDGVVPTVRPLAAHLTDKVVVSVAAALLRQGREMVALQMARGSVAAELQAALPRSEVVAAFHHVPASHLVDLAKPLIGDVLICSDRSSATELVAGLVLSLRGLRPIVVGSLAHAGTLEAFTAVCVTVNLRYRVHSSVRLEGLPLTMGIGGQQPSR